MQRRRAFVLLAAASVSGTNFLRASPMPKQGRSLLSDAFQTHVAWVAEVLKRIETIKPGMTRKRLLTVFTTEGGLSTGLQRTYVSQDCPYFKVDVEFQAVGRQGRDSDGRVTLVEGDDDLLLRISKPFLQFSISD